MISRWNERQKKKTKVEDVQENFTGKKRNGKQTVWGQCL